jgi:hypothetical protein
MHPELNSDRDGSGSAQESEKYSRLECELDRHLGMVRDTYQAYRQTVKRRLFI